MLKIFKYLFDFSESSWHQKIFIYGLYLSYLLYFFAISGIVYYNPNYLHNLETFIKYYVAIILLIRFNPFIAKEKVKVDTEFDRRVAFSAGAFLLLSSSAIDYIKSFIIKYSPIKNKTNNNIKNNNNIKDNNN